MSKSFAAPLRIRRIAARRVFKAPSGKPVVVTLGVPQAVPGSDWGCPLQITGLNTTWRRPKYVFGIDGLQALHLAMKRADAVLQSAKLKLEWLGQTEDLGMPKFLQRYRSHTKIASKRWSSARRPSSGGESSALTRRRLRSAASESIADLADDYGEDPLNIEEAVRCELQPAKAA